MSEILNRTDKEYIASMIPDSTPDWKKSWEEGYKIGQGIEIPETPFMKKYGVKNIADYLLMLGEQGKVLFKLNIGLASLEEEIAAMKEFEKWNEETGLNVSILHQLPQITIGVPKEKRENLPTALSFMLEEPEDWLNIAMASTVQPTFEDQHLGWPNAVENTINALKAGSTYTGLFGMFFQIAPGCPEEVWNQNENTKALGIAAAKYDEKVVINSNMDDSAPAYFMDFASFLAWGELERYIVSDLCKARYSYTFGNFTTNFQYAAAMILAASDTFKKDDQPGNAYIQGDTLDAWDHHIHGNYAPAVTESLMLILLARKYRIGFGYIAAPITERITVPTLQELFDISCAVQRTEEFAVYFEDLIDWTVIENLRDKLKEFSGKMFKNILNGLKESGVDITNPTEMMVVLKRTNMARFEKMFHPSIVNDGNTHIVPLMPATLWERSKKLVEDFANRLKDTEYAEKLKGKRLCVVSADIHYAGALVIAETLQKLGVDAIYGGSTLEALDVLDLADEQGITDICISLHNGQALPYSKLLLELASKRNKKYRFFMGGVLTSFVNESDKEPTDVTNILKGLGVHTSTSVEDLIEKLTEQ
jgi:methylmalonyl-CoA mutase cobalamin-binding subunit